jgi:hypothetical protein
MTWILAMSEAAAFFRDAPHDRRVERIHPRQIHSRDSAVVKRIGI